MKIKGICFSRYGLKLQERVRKELMERNQSDDLEAEWFYRGSMTQEEVGSAKKLTVSIHEWTEENFNHCDVLLFIGACGIAVRAIAPFVRDKRHDPAVIVMDEMGRFCIPILSGHVGGANAFAVRLADLLSGIPVITTATDIHNKFAVDLYAKKHHLTMSNATYAKEVSAAVVSGEPVGFYTNFPVEGELPEGLVWSDKLDQAIRDSGEREGGISLGIYISPSYNRAYFDHTLWLIPRCLAIGIGCKKGTSSHAIEQFVRDTLSKFSLYEEAICNVSTIDLKKDDPGLLAFCKSRELPFTTYSAEELRSVPGTFTRSGFVEQITGVDNVCERSAVLSGGGELLIPKQARDGMTLAVAMTDWKVVF